MDNGTSVVPDYKYCGSLRAQEGGQYMFDFTRPEFPCRRRIRIIKTWTCCRSTRRITLVYDESNPLRASKTQLHSCCRDCASKPPPFTEHKQQKVSISFAMSRSTTFFNTVNTVLFYDLNIDLISVQHNLPVKATQDSPILSPLPRKTAPPVTQNNVNLD